MLGGHSVTSCTAIKKRERDLGIIDPSLLFKVHGDNINTIVVFFSFQKSELRSIILFMLFLCQG